MIDRSIYKWNKRTKFDWQAQAARRIGESKNKEARRQRRKSE